MNKLRLSRYGSSFGRCLKFRCLNQFRHVRRGARILHFGTPVITDWCVAEDIRRHVCAQVIAEITRQCYTSNGYLSGKTTKNNKFVKQGRCHDATLYSTAGANTVGRPMV